MKLSKEQNKALNSIIDWSKNDQDKWFFKLGGFAGCVDADTEFLTPDGWKRIADYKKNDKVLQWKENGETEFVDVKRTKVKQDKLINIKNKTLEMTLSSGHRVPYLTSIGNLNVKSTAEILSMSSVDIPRGFKAPDLKGLTMSDELMRVLIMQSADGYIVNSKKNRYIDINVKKHSKKIRVAKLLREAGIPYKIYKSGKDYLKFHYECPKNIFTKNLNVLWKCNPDQLRIVVDEIVKWDGCIIKRKNVNTLKFTGTKNNSDFVQYAFSTVSGNYCSISKDHRSDDVYNVQLSSRNKSRLEISNKQKVSVKEVDTKDGYQYCFTTPSSFWLARCKDKIFVTGNTGKTFLLQHLIESYEGAAIVCTPTAKAASVLNKKLSEPIATTIHSVFYRPIEPDDTKLNSLRERLLVEPDNNQLIMELEKIEKEFKENELRFILQVNPDDIDRLVIIDESSMVSNEIMQDLRELNCKVLFVGDPGQLPPVKSKDWFTDVTPDAMLTQIHRQALDNPIIQLSMDIRNGCYRASNYQSEQCRIASKPKVKTSELVNCDQIITGMHKTRKHMNRLIRKKLKFEGDLPNKGEKLICRKNDKFKRISMDNNGNTVDKEIFFINGVQMVTKSDTELNFEHAIIDINYDDELITDVPFDRYYCESNYDNTLVQSAWYERKDLRELDYAYAITVHSSQGSEWDHVVVVDDKMRPMDKAFRIRWLYTAVTRAKKRLTLVQ